MIDRIKFELGVHSAKVTIGVLRGASASLVKRGQVSDAMILNSAAVILQRHLDTAQAKRGRS